MLGQSAKSRLLNRLRHKGGLSYGAGSMLQASNQDKRAGLLGFAICAPQNAVKAQEAMRAALPGVELALLVASTLHAVATGNLLMASVPTVCVDINPAVPTKLSDRGSFQAVGLVMDSSSFLRELARELGWKR